MFRRLFRWKKVSAARPSSWLDCDERECPVQQLVSREAGSALALNELAHGESLVGRGHRCSTARVDDYEGVSWLGRLEWPEWPMHEQSFENREEDLSIASCVESLWSRRCVRDGRGATGSLPSEEGLAERAGLQDWYSLRKDDCERNAVMAKLGLQVTCLDGISPMSKSYPGQKAVFSAYRGLSLYKSGGDATVAAAAAARRSPTSRGDICDENDVETKPGAGDYGHSIEDNGKYRDRNGGSKNEQDERNVLNQRMNERHSASVECLNFETFHAKTSRVVSMRSNCSHLEGLLEEYEAQGKGTLNESGDDGGSRGGLANTSGSLDASTLSGDIKLDHIDDIDSRLHSTPARTNGGCGVEEDRRLQLGLGDFDYLGGTAACSLARGETVLHVKVTGSGDCEQDSGGSKRLPATSSPIPTETDTNDASPGSFGEGAVIGSKVVVLNDELFSAELVETKPLTDDSFSSDVTVRRLSFGDTINAAGSEFTSQHGSETAGELIDAEFDTDCLEGAAIEADFFSYADLDSDLVSTPAAIQNKRTARLRKPQSSEWCGFDVFQEQRSDGYFGVFEARPLRKCAECMSASKSCEAIQSSNSSITAFNSHPTSAHRLTKLAMTIYDKEQRQLCSSPTNSIDGQASVSSYGSFLTFDSYEDADFPDTKLVGCCTNTDSAPDLTFAKALSPAIVHSPSHPQSQSFQSYEETVGLCPVGCATSDELSSSMNLAETYSFAATDTQMPSEQQCFQSFEAAEHSSCHAEPYAKSVCSPHEPDERSSSTDNEPMVKEPGHASSTTTLSFHVLEDADENKSSSDRTSSSSSRSSSINTDSISSGSSSGSSSPESSTHSDEEDMSAVKTSHTPQESTSPVQSNTGYKFVSNSGASSPFPLQDYRSCRDFLRRLTDENPELSYSLSASLASENYGVAENASIEDVCSQIFSSYNESLTHFETLQSFPALPRSNATEMFTCPELRPLRLGNSSKDVFEPVLSRDKNKRLKRLVVPAASSDTAATTSKPSDKWYHMPSASSVSMPDLKHSQKSTWPPDIQELNGAAATSDADLTSVRAHTTASRKALELQV
ncbi:uncharacterized protein LOC142775734 [Rhipicephalus microplus]|uniref:uncharacterized protein LOC142775734 n=1 Tax=Rhipicephalus microplus TaxID=6941 RepID=UPI003F6BC882